MASLSANERLFLIDLEKVEKDVDDWDITTTQSDRDKTKDAFYRLLGSAQAYLKAYPNKLRQLIDKIDGYTQQWNHWVERGTSQARIKERLQQTVFPTLKSLVSFSEVNIPALSAAREAEVNQAISKAAALEKKLQAGEVEKVGLVEKAKTSKAVAAGAFILVLLGGAALVFKKKKRRK
jgi:flagellar biosynthesis chaperone FliJ